MTYNATNLEKRIPAKELEDLLTSLRQGAHHKAAFGELPYNYSIIQNVFQDALAQKVLNSNAVILIGIGGSNLGCLAVYEALAGNWYNETKRPTFYCADTIDPEKLEKIITQIKKIYMQQGKVSCVIISKSGTTLETMVNASCIVDVLKKLYPKTYHELIVCISDPKTPLYAFAQQEKCLFISIPEDIGGRFSVFSPVGLFPLALLGVDIIAFCAGARRASDEVLQNGFPQENRAAHSAALLYALYTRGYTNHNLFLFDDTLESLGKWYRQLLAESLGKNGKGFVPLVSIGTVDLHSMTQLFLDGPQNTITTFVFTNSVQEGPVIPTSPLLPTSITKHSPAGLKKVLFQSTVAAFCSQDRPNATIEIDKTAHDLGFFMQTMMFQVVYLAKLFNCNPFDQPAVELYKKEAIRILKP